MALRGIEAVLFLASFHFSLLVAHASGPWYLLIPPADYSTATHRYTSVTDAPPGRWYHAGEYGSERECQDARGAKGGEAKRLSTTVLDADNYYHAQAWAFQHGRCVSRDDVLKFR
jgi:hypothetical protein